MLSLRLIRRRIKSVENTKKMTRAMEMVAASKLKKLQDLLKQSDRYIGELKRILGTLVREKPLAHPLLENRTLHEDKTQIIEKRPALVFLITSDTGLCGSYNTNLVDQISRFLREESEGRAFRFVAIGKNGAAYLKRQGLSLDQVIPVPKPQDIESAIENVTRTAVDAFTEGSVDEVFFIYTKVRSLGSLKPEATRLFPISPEGKTEKSKTEVDYILDPNLNEILEIMLPEFIQAEIGQFIKNSLVAEQASRMAAMRQATDNAKEMIDSLTLMRNKARQASITKELLEIVSGSRALQMK